MTAISILVSNLLGAVLILAALRDIFHELFHPSGRGTITLLITRVGWRIFRSLSSRRMSLLKLSGPSIMLLVLSGWIFILILGWVFVFWPYMPEGFLYSTGLKPSDNGGFLDALYLSAVTLTTLGYGDISPVNATLRLLVPVEAMVGFALLTAGLTWFLSLYPNLSQRRSLAHRMWLLREAEDETGVSAEAPEAEPGDLLPELTAQLSTVRRDLVQFPISYYFHTTDEKSSLPATLPYLLYLARRLENPRNPAPLRFAPPCCVEPWKISPLPWHPVS